jgi:hypothetical protein
MTRGDVIEELKDSPPPLPSVLQKSQTCRSGVAHIKPFRRGRATTRHDKRSGNYRYSFATCATFCAID